tara:strand:- start:429 stop:1382 length:954 start_codon:yes stop_codon:yes gene_type:complete
MNEIKDTIIAAKPTLKPNSLNLYLRNLKIVYQSVNEIEYLPKNIDFLNDHKKVLKYLDTRVESTRKTYFTSIIVALQAYKNKELYEIYNEPYEILTAKLKQIAQSQVKTPKEIENWTSLKILKSVLETYKKQLIATGVFKLDSLITPSDFKLLQKYLVGMLYIGSPKNPPMRNNYNMKIIKNFKYIKLSPEQQNEENYLVITGKNKKMFIFNEYKTSGIYGKKEIPVSSTLNKVLNVWLHYNNSDSLLLNSKREPLSDNGLTKLITATFAPTGKILGATMLRHIFISEMFPADLEKRKSLANLMGHSVSVQLEYAKI